MFNILINELIYFITIIFILFFIKRLRVKIISFRKVIALAFAIVTIHFLVSFTLALLNIADIWFPYILNIESDFPRPQKDYDIGNLLLLLVVIYTINLLGCGWGLISLFRKKSPAILSLQK